MTFLTAALYGFVPASTFNAQLKRKGIPILSRKGIRNYKTSAAKEQRSGATGFWGNNILLARIVCLTFIDLPRLPETMIADADRGFCCSVAWTIAMSTAIGFWHVWAAIAMFISWILVNLFRFSQSTNFSKASSCWRSRARNRLPHYRVMEIPGTVMALIRTAEEIQGAKTGLDMLEEDPLVWVRPKGILARKRYIAFFNAPGIEKFIF